MPHRRKCKRRITRITLGASRPDCYPGKMTETTSAYLNNAARSEWVRLRTLIFLRWMAVAGQIAAVVLATFALGLDLRLDLGALAIGMSVAFNVTSIIVYPENKRLSERTATLTLLFDLLQLAALLAMCGGLTNPFAVLILAPVIIAATALTLRATLVVGISAVGLVTLLTFFYWPLTLTTGEVLYQPALFTYGMWASMVIGIIFTGTYARRVTVETYLMSQALSATQMALGREQRLTALGGVVAAAAHELGTPLATIKLAAAELANELGDRPELLDDVKLILSQTDRCRIILAEMGRRGKDDTHLHHAPISAVIEEAAEPHRNRGKKLILRIDGVPQGGEQVPEQPEIARLPEIIHGLRNLVQNAVDFARSTVWIDVEWTNSILRVVVGDDGPGYPPDLIGRIGDPFVRQRKALLRTERIRPEYEGMGLGLFIAKTLLERSGAKLTFANGSETPEIRAESAESSELARPTGAMVEVIWQRRDLEATRSTTRGSLGQNRPITD